MILSIGTQAESRKWDLGSIPCRVKSVTAVPAVRLVAGRFWTRVHHEEGEINPAGRLGVASLPGVGDRNTSSSLEKAALAGDKCLVNQAFILGAGLGTRLQPLTHRLPKPLVPLFHKPLAEWALEACRAVGCTRYAINTHHLPDCWQSFQAEHPGVELFHEPLLLETGGGIKNIEPWLEDGPLLIHNGDIYSSMPLGRLVEAHRASDKLATLALRSHGKARHIALDETGTRVRDIHFKLGRAAGTHVFTGIYCIEPGLLRMLPANQKVSVIPTLLELAESGRLGAVVLDEGEWLDLGDREAYLQAHRELELGPRIHPEARVEEGAEVFHSVIGPGAVVGKDAVVRDSVLWPGARVMAGADLEQCILYTDTPVGGVQRGVDC